MLFRGGLLILRWLRQVDLRWLLDLNALGHRAILSGSVIDTISELVGWVSDRLPETFKHLLGFETRCTLAFIKLFAKVFNLQRVLTVSELVSKFELMRMELWRLEVMQKADELIYHFITLSQSWSLLVGISIVSLSTLCQLHLAKCVNHCLVNSCQLSITIVC